MTTTTILGFHAGAQEAYQEWSLPGGASAVPVLPATGTGKVPKTAAEVPEWAPAKRPSRIALMSKRCAWRTGRERIDRTICPLELRTALPTCGRTTVPPFASAEYATAIWSG